MIVRMDAQKSALFIILLLLLIHFRVQIYNIKMKVPNFVSKLSNQGALIHVLPHIHVEMLGDVEEFFLRFAIKAAEPSGSTKSLSMVIA